MQTNWKTFALYALCALLTISIGFSGVQKLMGVQSWIDQFRAFGYPIWFMYVIGVLQVFGSIGLWVPSTRKWAALVILTIMLGAGFSNLRAGQYTFIIPNIVLMNLAAAIVLLSRPSRSSTEI